MPDLINSPLNQSFGNRNAAYRAIYGDVTSARVLTTQHGGHPRGFGYVEMLKQRGECAMAELNGQRINFMVLRVGEAKS